MMLSLEQFLSLVQRQEIKHIVIYDLNKRRVGGKSGSAANNNSVQDIVDYVKEFANHLPGVYTIEAKKNFNNQKDSKLVYERVSLTNEAVAVQQKGVEAFVEKKDLIQLESDIRAKVLKEVKLEQERVIKEQQDKELREQYLAKTKELDTVAGKLMHIGTALLNGLISKSPVLNGLLNGTTNEMNAENTTTEQRQLSNEEIATANGALSILVQHMHAETLMKFAKKVQADPSVVDTLLKFL